MTVNTDNNSHSTKVNLINIKQKINIYKNKYIYIYINIKQIN